MRLSELQEKMVINVSDGKHLGIIVDALIKENGEIESFTIMTKHFWHFFFRNEAELNISFQQIKKIGEDVILVEL